LALTKNHQQAAGRTTAQNREQKWVNEGKKTENYVLWNLCSTYAHNLST
jgi:hypothetical protein